MDVDFAVMLNRDETLDLVNLEAAFRDPRTISLAYFQASLLVEHMVATYGDAGLHRLLRAYGEGLDSDEALRSALDTGFAELQTGFNDTVEARFGTLRRALDVGNEDVLALPLEAVRAAADRNPGNYQYHMRLGTMLREADRLDEALEAFERAAELVPKARGANNANAQIAQIAIEREDHARAIEALERLLEAEFDNVAAARTLVSLLREQEIIDPGRLLPVYTRIVAVDPFDADARAELGRLSLARGDAAMAIREFRAVLALEPVDRAAAHADLAESYMLDGRRAEARKETLAALEIAPGYERAQDLLLDLAGIGR